MFRSEVFDAQSDRLLGDVAVIVPISWHLIGYMLFGSALSCFAFLSFANYARVETVSGAIAPAAGVSAILPLRNGVVSSLPIREGQDVGVGTMLAAIRAEEDSASGVTAAVQIEAAIARQDASLTAQSGAMEASAQAELRQLAEQRSGAVAEVEQLRRQIALQQSLVTSAQHDLDRAASLADHGFVSLHDLEQRKENLLARQQGLSQLTQALAAKRATVAEADRNAVQITAQARAQSASLAASRAEVAQQAASTASTRAYVLRAPIAGRVTALTARVGQPAVAQTPLMTIVPANSVLQAELAVPSAAIGFVKPGQEVRLAIDAFPYQRFGTVTGKVLTVATSAINRTAEAGGVVTVYPVTVALDRASIYAYGRNEQLVAGMTLTARIVTERQSLLAWLFEPVLAVQRR